jgi:hypothetical protein
MTLRESCLVVLPYWQGLGLGPRLSDRVGFLEIRSGGDLYSKTAHPRLGAYRESRPELWAPTGANRKASAERGEGHLRHESWRRGDQYLGSLRHSPQGMAPWPFDIVMRDDDDCDDVDDKREGDK